MKPGSGRTLSSFSSAMQNAGTCRSVCRGVGGVGQSRKILMLGPGQTGMTGASPPVLSML
jgi:hypothetical protein